MKRNIKTYLIIAASAMLGLSSCLDKLPENAIPSDEAISSVDNADQAVMGIYASFKSGALYSGYLTLLPDLQADFAYAVNGYSNTYGDIWRWNILATNSEVEAVYASLYGIIENCNFLLDKLPGLKADITDDEALERIDQYNGEACLARAMAYSELIKMYCKAYESDEEAKNELGVVLKEHYNSKEPLRRATLAESYEFVLRDLDRAAELLKLEDDFSGNLYNAAYFCEYTVYALRARIALYMKHWDEAILYSTKVIDSGYYFLSSVNEMVSSDQSYFDYMWTSDNATEIIWKIGFTTTSYGGRLGSVFFNYDYRSMKPDYVPAQWVLNLYSANDLRASSYFRTFTTGYSHGLTWPLLKKYFGNDEFFNNQLLHLCMPKVFRLGEQYLIRAEAYCQGSKPDYSKASKDISTLRAARFSANGAITVAADNAMEVIEQERVRELYMEGFRLQDLKRWHKGFERKPQLQTLSNGNSLKVDAGNPLFVWPIPQHELESPGADIEPNESNK